jgi:hypothetical protein
LDGTPEKEIMELKMNVISKMGDSVRRALLEHGNSLSEKEWLECASEALDSELEGIEARLQDLAKENVDTEL